MSTSLFAHLPTIPTPPTYTTFAHISAFSLLSLMCTNKVPRHPLFVTAWYFTSLTFNFAWLRLKFTQVKAKLLRDVNGFLEKEGACEHCRRIVFEGDAGQMMTLLEDLQAAKRRARREGGEKGRAAEGGPCAKSGAGEAGGQEGVLEGGTVVENGVSGARGR